MTDGSTGELRIRPVALCYCGAPLVPTFAFALAEYYCLDCGGTYGMFDVELDRTPSVDRVCDAADRKQEWIDNAALALLVPGSKLRDCEACWNGGGDHPDHATDDERAADVRAREWIAKRRVTPEHAGQSTP